MLRTCIPNLLTLSRIAVLPVIVWLFLSGGEGRYAIIFWLLLASSLTDFFDGYLARKWNAYSDLGRMLDPLADKLLVATLLLLLVRENTILLWPAWLILMREIAVSGLREFLGPKGVVVHVSQLAKWKTTLQLVALVVLVGQLAWPLVALTSYDGIALLWIAALLTVWTGAEYFRGAWKHL